MSDVKTQKTVVLLSMEDTDKNLIINGIMISSIFQKELCLCYNYKKKEKTDFEKIKTQLQSYLVPIKNELPNLKVSTLLISENLINLPERLADDYEAILLIAGTGKFQKYSKSVAESAIPFLFVNENSKQYSAFKKLILPVDLRKENSESALWCSYFGRFNSAGVVVVAPNHKQSDEQRQIKTNLALTKKLFQKFKIEHKIFMGSKSSLKNSYEALDLAHSSKSDLLVILGSSVITPLDILVGLPEKKIIQKSGDLPVLVINPIKDNYILCD
jgi:hypothetical protein